jgi:hypothetical protein
MASLETGSASNCGPDGVDNRLNVAAWFRIRVRGIDRPAVRVAAMFPASRTTKMSPTNWSKMISASVFVGGVFYYRMYVRFL